MEAIARSYLEKGEVGIAAKMLSSLELTQPRVAKLARYCRVLADPVAVPIPYRFADVAEAILDPSMPLEAYFGAMSSTEETLQRYNRLLLLIHPDKNPYRKAGDAFVRLKTLKEAALTSVEDKRAALKSQEREDREYERLRATPPPVPPATTHATRGSKATSSGNKQGPQTRSKPRCGPQADSASVATKPVVLVSSLQPVRLVRRMREPNWEPSCENDVHLMETPSSSSSGQQRHSAPLASPPTTTPKDDHLLHVMQALHQYKRPLTLKCTFDGATSGNGTTGSTPPAPAFGEGDDDDEETLNCTVYSTLTASSLDGSGPAVVRTASSTFSLKGSSSSQPQLDAEGSVVHQSLLSTFSASALATTQAAWTGYRQRRQESVEEAVGGPS